MNLSDLHQEIDNSFNLEEIKDLCFRLDIDFQNLSGDAKSGKVRELILFCERHDLLSLLIKECKELRPQGEWSEVISSSQTNPADNTKQNVSPSISENKTLIIVAVIGLIGTISAALIGLIPNILNRDIPIEPAAEVLITETPTASHNQENTQTDQPAITPTEIQITETPQINSPTITPIPTSTPTVIPTPTPIILLHGSDWETGCISDQLWIPYQGEAQPVDEFGCWDLLDWGLSASSNELLVFVNNSPVMANGIYTEVADNSKISLEFEIDEMNAKFEQEPLIEFGILPNPFSSKDEGSFLEFVVREANQTDTYVRTVSNGEPTFLPIRADFNEAISVAFHINGPELKIFIDGNLRSTFPLTYTSKYFWIGYRFPSTSNVRVDISNLSIE